MDFLRGASLNTVEPPRCSTTRWCSKKEHLGPTLHHGAPIAQSNRPAGLTRAASGRDATAAHRARAPDEVATCALGVPEAVVAEPPVAAAPPDPVSPPARPGCDDSVSSEQLAVQAKINAKANRGL
jgi:hypothetical protein